MTKGFRDSAWLNARHRLVTGRTRARTLLVLGPHAVRHHPFFSISISTLSKTNTQGIFENNFQERLKSLLKALGYFSSYHECWWGSGRCSDCHFREKEIFLLNQPIILSHGRDLQVKGQKMSVCIRQQLLSIFIVQYGRNWLCHHFLTDGLKHVLVRHMRGEGWIFLISLIQATPCTVDIW